MALQLRTRDLTDVEILDVGTWDASTGPVKITEAFADELVENTNELIALGLLAPPAKLGHPKNQKLLQQEGWPAAGWIRNLRRDGTKILADVAKVPERLAGLIDAGGYRKISAEFWKTFGKIGGRGKSYGPVLTAIAFLGEELPAIATLDDMLAIFSTGLQPAVVKLSSGREGTTVVELSKSAKADDLDGEDLIREAEKFVERAAERTKGKVGAPRLRAFLDEIRRRVREMIGTAEAAHGEVTAVSHTFDTAGGEPEWAEIDRAELPAEAFAVVGDPDTRSSWKLPHHFLRDGTLYAHAGGIRAALAALGGARTGDPMDAPASIRAHLEEHASRAGIGEKNDEEADMANKAVATALGLPEDADDAAILAKIGELKSGTEQLSATQRQVQELAAAEATRNATDKVEAAIRERKLRPAEKTFWTAFAKEKPEEFTKHVEALPALFTGERGTAVDAPDSSAIEQINRLANERMAEANARGTKLALRDAIAQVTREQPELGRQVRAERRRGGPAVVAS